MGWDANAIDRLLDSDIELNTVAFLLSGLLYDRVARSGVTCQFRLYRHDPGGDQCRLEILWSCGEGRERLVVGEDSSFDPDEPRDPKSELLLPLLSEQGVVGFGLLQRIDGPELAEVPSEELTFLSRISGRAFEQHLQSDRLAFAHGALESTTRYMEKILSLSSDAMLLLDPESRIVVANESVEALLGVYSTDITGRTLGEALSAEQNLALATGSTLASGQGTTVSRILELPVSGCAKKVEATFEPMQTAAGTAVLICLHDLSEAIGEEWFENRASRVGLAQSSQLQQPVAALRGYLWLLRDELSSRGRVADILQTLDLQAEWLQSQLEAQALLDEFRTGSRRWRDRPVSPWVLIDRALSRLRSRLGSWGVEARSEVSDELPWIRVDVEKWVVVFSALLEQTARNQGPGTLVIEERPDGRNRSQLHVRIRMEPSGAPGGTRSSPYQSAIPDSQFAYGVPLARTIVHHYGGTLLCDWKDGVEVAVDLTLPVEVSDEPR